MGTAATNSDPGASPSPSKGQQPPIPADLLQAPESTVQPPAATARQLLPIAELSWQDFERLCTQIAVEEGNAEIVKRFGSPGQAQSGIDIYARKKNGRYVVYQCRQRKSLTSRDIKAAVEDFAKGEWAPLAEEFVICTSADGSSAQVLKELEKQASAMRTAHPGLSVRLDDRADLSMRLKRCPDLVLDFFGPAWVDQFLKRGSQQPVSPEIVRKLPRLKDLSWRELGVRRAGRACDADGWTPKLERPVDSKLRALLRRAVKPAQEERDSMRFIVLIGEPGTGKSRAMFDAVTAICPEAWIYRPNHHDPSSLAAVLDRGDLARFAPEPRTPLLIWLDDLELFVPPDETGLTATRLNTLRYSNRPIVVLATAGGKSADIARARRPAPDDKGTVLSLVLAERTVQVRVAAKGLTTAVIEKGVEAGDYQRDDAAAIRAHGVGPFVLGADLLFLKLHTGRFPPEAPPSSAGVAVTKAVLAWNACGIPRPIDRERLKKLWIHYFQGEPSEVEFEEGLAWAQEPVIGDMALLEREELQYRCNDLVVAASRLAMEKGDYLRVLNAAGPSEAAWIPYGGGGFQPRVDALKEFLRQHEPLDDAWWPFEVAMGHVWRTLSQPELARKSWEKGLADGCFCAAVSISRMKSDEGDLSGAAEALQRLLDGGFGGVAIEASSLYTRMGDHKRSLAALESGAEAGDGESAFVLGRRLRRVDEKQAEWALRKALELGFGGAWSSLWSIYMGREEYASAEKVALQGADLGIGEAACVLGLLREEHLRDQQGAIEAYRHACDLEELIAYALLGNLYRSRGEDGDDERAIAAFETGATLGSAESSHMLGHHLEDGGDIDGAANAFEEAITLGGLQPVACLGKLNSRRNLVLARERAQSAAERRSTPSVLFWLASATQAVDGIEAADPIWQAVLDTRHRETIYRAGVYRRDEGDFEGAERMLLEADELGFPAAACAIGHMWEKRGRKELAREAGRRARALGHECTLAEARK